MHASFVESLPILGSCEECIFHPWLTLPGVWGKQNYMCMRRKEGLQVTQQWEEPRAAAQEQGHKPQQVLQQTANTIRTRYHSLSPHYQL